MRDSKRDTYGAGLSSTTVSASSADEPRASYDANRSTDSPILLAVLPYAAHNVPISETTTTSRTYVRLFGARPPLYEREYLNNFSRSNYRTLQDNFAINFYAAALHRQGLDHPEPTLYESRVFVDPLSASNSAFLLQRLRSWVR